MMVLFRNFLKAARIFWSDEYGGASRKGVIRLALLGLFSAIFAKDALAYTWRTCRAWVGCTATCEDTTEGPVTLSVCRESWAKVRSSDCDNSEASGGVNLKWDDLSDSAQAEDADPTIHCINPGAVPEEAGKLVEDDGTYGATFTFTELGYQAHNNKLNFWVADDIEIKATHTHTLSDACPNKGIRSQWAWEYYKGDCWAHSYCFSTDGHAYTDCSHRTVYCVQAYIFINEWILPLKSFEELDLIPDVDQDDFTVGNPCEDYIETAQIKSSLFD